MGTLTVLSVAAGRTSTQITGGEGDVTTLLTPVGLGTTGLAIAIVLVVLFGYLNVLSAGPDADRRLRGVIVCVTVPLLATFGGIVFYESLQIVIG